VSRFTGNISETQRAPIVLEEHLQEASWLLRRTGGQVRFGSIRLGSPPRFDESGQFRREPIYFAGLQTRAPSIRPLGFVHELDKIALLVYNDLPACANQLSVKWGVTEGNHRYLGCCRVVAVIRHGGGHTNSSLELGEQ